MLVRLAWINNNDASAVVQVYRDTVAINTASPPAPIATLAGNATTYDDTTALAGVQYYYAVAVSKGSNKVWTPVKTFTNEAKRGPGSSRILYGNERLGYLGSLAQTDFIDAGKVLGIPATVAANHRFTWHKFIRKGTILYVAGHPMNTANIGDRVWAQDVRRNTGLVSGMAWNFDNSSWPDATKTAQVQFQGSTFNFRAPRGLPDNWDGSAITAAMVADPTTEFNEVFSCLLANELYFPNPIGSVRTGATVVTPNMGPIAMAERQGTGNLFRNMQEFANGANGVTGAIMTNLGSSTTFWPYPSTGARTKNGFLTYGFRPDSMTQPTWTSAQWDLVWPMFELVG